MLQPSNPPAFPKSGTRSKSFAAFFVLSLVGALIIGAILMGRMHPPRRVEMTPVPPSYADALKQAEAEDLAKGLTPEMATHLRAEAVASSNQRRGQY